MSQLLAPEKTAADGIPLWLRIREVMKEQGSSYSLTAVAGRLGISRETLRLMLSGEREIYSFELEKIAMDLKISIPRLLQQDVGILNSRDRIRNFVTQGMWAEALQIAKQREKVSIGLSERAETLSVTGYIYTWKKDLEEAKRCYEEMLVFAKEIHERYGWSVLLVKAFQNLLNTLTLLRDADRAAELIKIAEPHFHSKPIDLGTIYFFKARMHLELLERAAAKECFYKSLELTLQDTNEDEIGRSYYNVAWAEYADCQYLIAKENLEHSIRAANSDMEQFFSKFKLAKTLFKLNELQGALDLIRECLAAEQLANHMEMRGKLLILLTRVTRETRYASQVALSLDYPQRIRYLAYRYLSIIDRQRKVGRSRFSTGRQARGRMPMRRFPLDLNF